MGPHADDFDGFCSLDDLIDQAVPDGLPARLLAALTQGGLEALADGLAHARNRKQVQGLLVSWMLRQSPSESRTAAARLPAM